VKRRGNAPFKMLTMSAYMDLRFKDIIRRVEESVVLFDYFRVYQFAQ